MRSKRRYQKKDIIVKKSKGFHDNPHEGKVAAVISVIGESLEIVRKNISKPEPNRYTLISQVHKQLNI